MKKSLILLIVLFIAPLSSFPFKEIFFKGDPGDFSIYQNGPLVTILNIHSKELPYITFEEITLSKKLYNNIKGKDLKTWIKRGGNGSSSWTLVEIDTNSMDVTRAYCFHKQMHLDINKDDTLITCLLDLNISNVPEEEIARIGPRQATKTDSRPFWEPSMIIDGKRRAPSKMDVYGGTWKKDDSPLSGRNIDIYILNDFPFPYWMQIHGDFGSKKMISLDSGKNLTSPIQHVPAMPPKFISGLEKWNNTEMFSFLVKADRKAVDFTLYFMEMARDANKLIPIESKYKVIDTGVLKFNLLKQRLVQELTPGKTYRLYLSYTDGNQINSIVSKDIIHWK
ncbi:MAG: hypothetical protein SP4CHLAM5_10910 [Chlamydiia bacterium]|nr:hypothetical protein [Chlamydiia bacterium]MCH9618948.1 hypothetical protein [Chlamydiia bacterium]MCH9624710.1 hypothetical protein [Chlamydiia bacterium]